VQVCGLGLDMVVVERVASALDRRGDRFAARVLSQAELDEIDQRGLRGPAKAQYLAGRLAAKEAVSKAIGVGVGRIGWRAVAVTADVNGRPICSLSGNAAAAASRMGIGQVLVSITHTATTAAASAVALGGEFKGRSKCRCECGGGQGR
jgi:holo-[acyl-carrier protein] synthase